MCSLYYHYSSLNVLFSIIPKKKLWLSNLANSNDPNELYLSCDEYNNYVFNKLHLDPYHGRPHIADIKKILGNPYGMSFTNLEDELAQWERYGDRCRGVAIALDVPALNEYLQKNYGCNMNFEAVRYTEEEKTEYIKKLISDMPSFENFCYKMQWPFVAFHYIMQYAQRRVLFKREGFALEKEYRLYIDLNETSFYHDSIQLLLENSKEELEEYHKEYEMQIHKHHLTEQNKKYALMRNGINSYLSLDLSLLGDGMESIIKEVIIGPKCMQNSEELKNFCKANGFSVTVKRSKIEIV